MEISNFGRGRYKKYLEIFLASPSRSSKVFEVVCFTTTFQG